jgi:hypothetical protein
MLHWLIRKVIGKIAAIPVRKRLNAFNLATESPQATQEELLRRMLAAQADTDFARDHHFPSINTVADYRKHLPLAPYEYFEPYIKRVMKGETKALLADPRIHMFALTSGTTASRKFIPVTQQYLADYKRGWNIWGLKVYRDHPSVRFRPIVQMSGDWQEFKTEAGIPCGAVTGLTATMQLRIIRFLYCVPASVGKVKDPAAKYYTALRLSLPRKVSMIIAANPSTLVNFAKAGDQEKESLIRDIRDGTLSSRYDIPVDVRTALARRIRKKHPERAKWLEEIVSRTGTLYPKDYWPTDCVIGNWTGGSVGAYLRHYPKYFGQTPHDDSVGRRHAGGHPRHHHELLRIHPRGRSQQPTTHRAGDARAARGAELLHPLDHVVRPLPLSHLRRGPLRRLPQQDAHGRVPEQGLLVLEPHRREGVRVPRLRRDDRRAAVAGHEPHGLYAGPMLGRRAALLRPVCRARRHP